MHLSSINTHHGHGAKENAGQVKMLSQAVYACRNSKNHTAVSPTATAPQVSVERLDHSILIRRVDGTRALALTQPEHRLHDRKLGGSSVETGDGHPVVDDHAGADNRASSIDAASDKRYL